MEHREWLSSDYYADLGVTRSASTEDITERYRARAWELHPDRNPDRGETEAEFKRLARAYAVLGNPERRRAYDATRDAVFDRGFAPVAGTTRPAPLRRQSAGFQLAPRFAALGGIACLVLGALVAAVIVGMTSREGRIRAEGIAVIGVVTQVSPEPRIQFTTPDGTTETVAAPRVRDRRNRGYQLGERLPVRYLDRDPSKVVIVESTVARDITMWIIAVKLLVCGALLIGLAVRQSRSARRRGDAPGEQPVPQRAVLQRAGR